MNIKIVGIEKVNYKKKDGTEVSGANINYIDQSVIQNGEGFRCYREYVSSSHLPSDLKLGNASVDFGRGYNGSAYISSLRMV